MIKVPKSALIALAAAALALSIVPAAVATPTLRLSDGVNTVTIADGSGLDGDSSAGQVAYVGSVGSFFLNIVTGTSKPDIGSAAAPSLDLTSLNISGGNGGTLTIRFSDTGFGPSSGNLGVLSSISGTALGDNVVYSTFQDTSNTLFGTANLLTTSGMNSTITGTLANAFVYSLTQELQISSFGGSLTIVDASLNATTGDPAPTQSVPDGGSSVALLGIALVAVGAVRRKLSVAAH